MNSLDGIRLLILLIGAYLFSYGLYLSSQAAGEKVFGNASAAGQENRSLRFVLGIILFSGLCNAILLVPTILEGAFNLPAATALLLHHGSILTLKILVAALSMVGLLTLASRFRLCEAFVGRWGERLLGRTFVDSATDGTTLFLLSVALSAYLFNALRGEYVYDTGLYHFPFVSHVRAYGLEIGLANLHSRYAFYNIQQFGQVALQAFSPAGRLASPSLNLLFLAALLMGAHDAIARRLAAARADARLLSSLSYWVLMFGFGTTSAASLISFDADYSLSIATALVLFRFLSAARRTPLPREAAVLLACLPLIKLAGVVAILFAGVFALSLAALQAFHVGWPRLWEDGRSALPPWRGARDRLLLVLVAGLYSLMLITNLALSGYGLYPQAQTGPIGAHAVPVQQVRSEKELAILSWARQGLDRETPGDRSLPARTWVPRFLKTQRGRTLTLWILSSLCVAAGSGVAALRPGRDPGFRVLAASASATGVASLAVLLALPPDPRFYSWLRALTFFNVVEWLLLAPVSALVGLLLVSCLTGPGRQKIGVLPEASFRSWSPPRGAGGSGWRFRSRNGTSPPTVHVPTGTDQCWGAPPPCSPTSPAARNGDRTESGRRR